MSLKEQEHICGYKMGEMQCKNCDTKLFDSLISTQVMAAQKNMEIFKKMDKPKEMVDHPDHYKGHKYEVIDIIHDYELGFDLGNAIKYILRAGKKDEIKQELKKAIWYIESYIKELDKK